jgi:endonuclease/exonuclease/phosphatase family metal-dependent hydrolase
MLKVLTLNLNGYNEKHGSWAVRQDLIAAAIQEAQPDILAFQAVQKDPNIAEGDDQADQIASRFTHYPYVHFQPAIIHKDKRAEGSAILSTIPFLDVDCRKLTLLPGTDDPTHRVILHARFDLPTGPLHLFNAHFSWVDEQAQENLEESLSFLESFQGQRMLVGDLNASPDSSVIKQFEEAGWIDAWTALHPDQNGFTFESNSLSKRIDYVWVDESLKGKLHAIQVVANIENDKGARPSDHVGLLVDFSFSDG